MTTTKKIVTWTAIGIVGVFCIIVLYRTVYLWNKDKTDAVVEKIHATKLTLDDVMGTNLPPDPGSEADKTIAGVDANDNGIRDDVELAIFKEYPDSAKTRAVLLQYALALQMEFTQKIVNTETVTAVVKEEDAAYSCVGRMYSRVNIDEYILKSNELRLFVKEKQFNNKLRLDFRDSFYDMVGSYESVKSCVVDYLNFPN